MPEDLFIYGTLRPDRAPAEIANAVARLRRVGMASVRGRLYDFGEYPGAVVDHNTRTRITGEVFQVPDEDTFRALDEYEGFNPRRPSSSLFIRKKVPVQFKNGSRRHCWVYLYNHDPGDAPLVAGSHRTRG